MQTLWYSGPLVWLYTWKCVNCIWECVNGQLLREPRKCVLNRAIKTSNAAHNKKHVWKLNMCITRAWGLKGVLCTIYIQWSFPKEHWHREVFPPLGQNKAYNRYNTCDSSSQCNVCILMQWNKEQTFNVWCVISSSSYYVNSMPEMSPKSSLAGKYIFTSNRVAKSSAKKIYSYYFIIINKSHTVAKICMQKLQHFMTQQTTACIHLNHRAVEFFWL